MLIIKTNPVKEWAEKEFTSLISFNPLKLYLRFLDRQKPFHLMWWFINLIVHANLVLAVPAILIWHFNAPIYVLGITCIAFFSNLVANMGGMGIRITLTAFFASLTINLIMIFIYTC